MACLTAPRVGICGATTACLCPLPPCRIGRRLGEKKAQGQMDGTVLDWALATFSGYVAADELYEGPYCVLSVVDNRQYKRLDSCVLADNRHTLTSLWPSVAWRTYGQRYLPPSVRAGVARGHTGSTPV